MALIPPKTWNMPSNILKTMADQPHVDHTREATLQFFSTYTKAHSNELKSKVVCDLSAGRGYIAHLFEQAGAHVKAFDLFPSQNQFANTAVEKIDLQKPFPIAGNTIDLALCCETIEHLPNQYFLFQETSRILKAGGRLILTTPNTSSLRSRFSQFLLESEHYSAPAPNELNAFTPWGNGPDGYFGKLFLSGILRLRTLAAVSDLKLKQVHSVKRSTTSMLLLVCFPMLYYFNWRVYRKQVKADQTNQVTYREIFKLATSMDVLLGKHLILEFEKSHE